MPSKKVVVPSVARMLRDIVTPKGFKREVTTEINRWNSKPYKVLVLASPSIKIEIYFTGNRKDFFLADGHVSFKADGGWRSYDRYGVEDSFYIENPLQWVGSRWEDGTDVIARANETIKNFIEVKIPESLALIARSESVPGIPFSVTPERKAAITKALKSKQSNTFMPSGFGIGYTLWTRKIDSFCERGSKEMEKFFGVSPIYISKFDAD